MRVPFPYWGAKWKVAAEIWRRFGDTPNYVEPFFGSGAVLFGRPEFKGHRLETVNDIDGMISNFWRSIQGDPDLVAHWADWPASENDQHARHAALVQWSQDGVLRLEGDPCFYDARMAGWWVWGVSQWMANGYCSGNGPWRVVDGKLVRTGDGYVKRGVSMLGHFRGIHSFKYRDGRLPHLFEALSHRLRHVRIACGDWSRIVGPSATSGAGLTAMLLDPPYSAEAGRCNRLYAYEDALVAHDVRAYCVLRGADPRMRIALCGYDGEHDELVDYGWAQHRWTNGSSYQGKNIGSQNRNREVLWFSPHCLG